MPFFLRTVGVLFFAIALSACGPSPAKVGEMTLLSMQQKFSSDPQLTELKISIEQVQVVKDGENRYQGVARVRHDGDLHEVPVQVTADGDAVIWKTDQGAFLFVAQKELRKAMQQTTPSEQ
jgi:hypothetical protein